MTYSLDDKIKNDYSTKLVLVVDPLRYYTRLTPAEEYYEKIADSNASLSNPRPVDPFRQATGKFWTFDQSDSQGSGYEGAIRFYDPNPSAWWGPEGGNYPNVDTSIFDWLNNPDMDFIHGYTFIPASYPLVYSDNDAGGLQAVRYYDNSSQWNEIMENVPIQDLPSFAIDRKSTRIYVKMLTPSPLKAQLTMLSLFCDIHRKNQIPAFAAGDEANDFGLKLPELTSAEEVLEGLKEQLQELIQTGNFLTDEQYLTLQIYKFLQDGLGDDLGGSGLEVLFALAWILGDDPNNPNSGLTSEQISEYFSENSASGLPWTPEDVKQFFMDEIYSPFAFAQENTDPPPWNNFGEYYEDLISKIDAEIQEGEDAIQDLEDQIEEYETVIIPDLEKQNEDYIGNVIKNYTTITFPGANADSNWNYYSYLDRDEIYADKAQYLTPFGDEQSEQTQAKFDETFKKVTEAALSTAIRASRMDSFYNFPEDDYNYYATGEGVSFRYFKDSAFEMKLPQPVKASNLISGQGNYNKSDMRVDITPTYNFYSKYYEKLSQEKSVENAQGTMTAYYPTYFDSIYETPFEENQAGIASPSPSADFNDSSFSFEKRAHNILNCKLTAENLSEFSDFDDKFNIIISQSNFLYLEKFNSVKDKFPFHIDYRLLVNENKEFSTAFNKSEFTACLIKTFISNFFYSAKLGASNYEPDKNNLIMNKGGGQEAFKYYDALDPEWSTLDGAAPICVKNIYRIESMKDFYKQVPPTTTAYAEMFDLEINESPEYNVREINLNRWMEEIITNGATSEFDDDIMGQDVAISSSKLFSSGEDEDGLMGYPIINPNGVGTANLEAAWAFQDLIQEKYRNYYEILGKEKAYNETLFYRIQKVEVDNLGNKSLVQNIWMVKPNDDSGADSMRYIDTQVRYGTDYEITIYAYQLVIGTKYGFQFENNHKYVTDVPSEFTNEYFALTGNSKYEDYISGMQLSAITIGGLPGASVTDDLMYEGNVAVNRLFYNNTRYLGIFDVICEPDAKVVEMPIYKKQVTISDAPPMFPEVDIVPLNGKNNDIKINFFPGSVSREMEPITVESAAGDITDNNKFLKIRKAQDRTLLKQEWAGYQGITQDKADTMFIYPPYWYVEPKLKFKSDDFVTHYQIYRLDSPPEKYSDFAGNRLLTIDSQNQSSYTDTIEQNKKYYYMFRSVDVHENISNPSLVYQVEMVENSGAVYPVVSIYNFEQEDSRTRSKSCKRHIKISPSPMMQQFSADLENESALKYEGAQTLKFGSAEIAADTVLKSTDTKRFKIRLKSKHTGKIVDLNVSFVYRQKTTNENIPTCGDDGYVEYNMAEAGSDELG